MTGRHVRAATACGALWLALAATIALAGEARGLAGTWSIHTGSNETLRLEAGTAGTTDLVGRLDGLELSGFVADGEIVLHGEGVLLWGWLGQDADGTRFLAGRRRDTSGNVDRVSGWYAVEAPRKAGAPQDEIETVGGDGGEAPSARTFDLVLPEATPPNAADGTPPPPAEASDVAGDGGPTEIFAGTWQGPDGLYRVEQEGSRITVHRPTGETVRGRQTDVGSLMVGLGVGCCRGELSAPGVIEWQDGTVWRRAD